MIVSGGHILAIDEVNHDFTLYGDGVNTPIGITEELLEEISDVSGKLDTTAFETWTAQTENWDVQEYSGGEGINVENHLISVSAKYLTSGDLEPYAETQWVQDELGKKVDVSTMSAYATSAWVDENFLKHADYHEYSAGNDYIRIDEYKIYGYDWTSAVSAVPFKLDTSAFEQYSGWAEDTYLKEEDLEPYATSAGLDHDQQYAMTDSGWAPVDIPDDTVVSGTSGISVQKIGDTWIVGTSAQYATAEQGEKADSAIQGVKANGTLLTPDDSKVVNITAESIGLGNVDNTSDEEKKSSFTGAVEPLNVGFVTGGDVYDAISESEAKPGSLSFLSGTGNEPVLTNDTVFHALSVDSIKIFFSGDFFELDDGILSLMKGVYSFSVKFSIDTEDLDGYEPSNNIQLVTFYVGGEVFTVNLDRSIELPAESVCFSGMVLITEDDTNFEIKVKTSSVDLLSVNLDSISLVKINSINIVKKRAYLMTSDSKFVITDDGKRIFSEYNV